MLTEVSTAEGAGYKLLSSISEINNETDDTMIFMFESEITMRSWLDSLLPVVPVRQSLSPLLNLYTHCSDSSSKMADILHYTGSFSLSLSQIPLYKKHFLLPFLQSSPTSSLQLVFNADAKTEQTKEKLDFINTFIVIDYSVRWNSSSPSAILDLLLPWSPTDEQARFIHQMRLTTQPMVSSTLTCLSSLCEEYSSVTPENSRWKFTKRRSSSSILLSTSLGGSRSPLFTFPDQTSKKVKPKPSAAEGLRVFEFFSGIGGMHVSLPPSIDGVPIREIVAFDCSEVANQVHLD